MALAERDWAAIRVFDFARDQQFLPFEDTVRLAAEHNLPLVAYKEHAMPPLPELLNCLISAAAAEACHARRAKSGGREPHEYHPLLPVAAAAEEGGGECEGDEGQEEHSGRRLLYSGVCADLEGYVLRVPGDGETVAKIRVDDMRRLIPI